MGAAPHPAISVPGQGRARRSLPWEAFKTALAGQRLPAAVVDLDALERNVDRIRSSLAGTTKTLRVSSKSIRHVGLLRRILDRGSDRFQGLLCFTVEEAVFLADEGFDDLLIAYPTLQPRALEALARLNADGRTVALVIDNELQLEALARAGRAMGTEMRAVAEVDVSLRMLGGRVHLGARRSPVRTAERTVELARAARALDGVRLVGIMGYEAQVAGLPDQSPFHNLNTAAKWVKRLSIPAVASLRRRTVEMLRAEGVELEIVNGGGSGSLESTAADPVVTEVAAGSGFVCSHLFDYFASLDVEPALFFALEACRTSDPGYVTCLGGGYVASGATGPDKSPLPWLPAGLELVSTEGAGEVQTPLIVPPEAVSPALGDPVIFRHAKAGELAERFLEYLMLRDGEVVTREPTYRGQGYCFL